MFLIEIEIVDIEGTCQRTLKTITPLKINAFARKFYFYF